MDEFVVGEIKKIYRKYYFSHDGIGQYGSFKGYFLTYLGKGKKVAAFLVNIN